MSKVRVSKSKQKKTGFKYLVKNLKWRYAAYFFAVIVIIQIFYPYSSAPGNSKFGSDSYSWESLDKITKKLQDKFESTTVKIQASDSQVKLKASEIGASVDIDSLAKRLARYDFWQRLVPFSIFFAGESIETVRFNFDDAALEKTITEISAKLNSEAKNGAIYIDGKIEIVVEPAKNGVKVEDSEIENSLKNHSYTIGKDNDFSITANITKPEIDNEKLDSLKSQLLAMGKVKITLTNSLTKKSIQSNQQRHLVVAKGRR